MNDQSDATATSSVATLPTGHQTVNPFVIVDGAAAFIDFVGGVFGAVEASNV